MRHNLGCFRITIVSDRLQWPNGLAIDKVSDRLYWNDGKLSVIESSKLNGHDRQLIISDVVQPYGLVVVGSHVYWTDWQTQKLHRADKFTGLNRTVIRDKLQGLMDVRAILDEPTPENVCGKNNGGCSHLCLRNPNSYSCGCPTGIAMSKHNSKVCETQPSTYLLFATRSALSRISLDTKEIWDFTLPIKEVEHAIDVDFHWEKKLIFFTDIDTDTINSVSMLNFSDSKVLVSKNISTPNGIAVDWIADNVYWTDTGNKVVEVARLDGSLRKVVVSENLQEPRSIAVFPKKGYLYWTDWGDSSKIERSHMDGSSRKAIITADLGFPNGLVLDYEAKRLYWSDAKWDRIETSDLFGRNRIQLVHTSPNVPSTHPFGLAQVTQTGFKLEHVANIFLRSTKTTFTGRIGIRSLCCVQTKPREQVSKLCEQSLMERWE